MIYLLYFSSAISTSILVVSAHSLLLDIGLYQTLFYRSVIVFLYGFLLIKVEKSKFRFKELKYVYLRSIFALFGIGLFFQNNNLNGPSSANFYHSFAPVIVMLFGVFLTQTNRKIVITSLLVSTMSILFFSKSQGNYNGLLLGCGGAFFAALSFKMLKLSTNTLPNSVVLFISPIPLALVSLYLIKVFIVPKSILLVIVFLLSAITSQHLLAQCYRKTSAWMASTPLVLSALFVTTYKGNVFDMGWNIVSFPLAFISIWIAVEESRKLKLNSSK